MTIVRGGSIIAGCTLALLCCIPWIADAARPQPSCSDPANPDRQQMEQRKADYLNALLASNVRKGRDDNTDLLNVRLAMGNWDDTPMCVKQPDGSCALPNLGDAVTAKAVQDWYLSKTNLKQLDGLEDTADFEANSLLRLLYLHSANSLLPAAVQERIGQSLTNFSYWIHDRATAANPRPVGDMVIWSENHQLLFATAELLAGQLYPQARFRDGRTGAEHQALARMRALRWIDERLRFGLNEWNSPGYYQYDLLPLLNLADFSADPEVQAGASLMLDLVVFDLARFTQRGNLGATAGRAYVEHKVVGWDQGVGESVQMLFGTRPRPAQFYLDTKNNSDEIGRWKNTALPWIGSSPGGIALATSRYCVPAALLAIGKDQPQQFVDRSRVSIGFDEAENYGIGFDNPSDGIFWWGKGAYATKYTVRETLEMVKTYGLFLPKMPDLIQRLVPVALQRIQTPGGIEQLADAASIVTEGMALTHADMYTYRNDDVMLSSVQNFRPGQSGPQINTWQVTIDNDLVVFGTYPLASDSHNGPNWWTGTAVMPRIVQHQDVAIVAFAPDMISIQKVVPDFLSTVSPGNRTHLWFPWRENAELPPKKFFEDSYFVLAGPGHFDNCQDLYRSDQPLNQQSAFFGCFERRVHNANVDGVWYFGMKRVTPGHEAYIGVFSAQHDCDFTKSGDWIGKEIVCNGLRNVFIVQVGNNHGGKFSSFDDFIAKATGARINISKGVRSPVLDAIGLSDVEASYDIPGGGRLELHYDQHHPRLNGQVYCDEDFPRFENPYTTANPDGRIAWGQRQYTIQIDGKKLYHDLDKAQRSGDGL